MIRAQLRSSILTAGLFASVVMINAFEARAQNLPEPRTRSVTPFLLTTLGVGDPAPGNSPGFGVGVTYDWMSGMAFEGEFGYLVDVAGEAPGIDWSIASFSVNFLYRFDTMYVTPYVTFGFGAEHSAFDSDPDNPPGSFAVASGTEFAVNFGAGLTRELTDRWRLRADLRRFESSDTSPDYWRLYGGLTFKIP